MATINTICDEYVYGEIFPNIFLVGFGEHKEGRFYETVNGVKSAVGRFGLTIKNDPFIIFSGLYEDEADYSDEELDSMEQDSIGQNKILRDRIIIQKNRKLLDEFVCHISDFMFLWKSVDSFVHFYSLDLGGYVLRKVAEMARTVDESAVVKYERTGVCIQ